MLKFFSITCLVLVAKIVKGEKIQKISFIWDKKSVDYVFHVERSWSKIGNFINQGEKGLQISQKFSNKIKRHIRFQEFT